MIRVPNIPKPMNEQQLKMIILHWTSTDELNYRPEAIQSNILYLYPRLKGAAISPAAVAKWVKDATVWWNSDVAQEQAHKLLLIYKFGAKEK